MCVYSEAEFLPLNISPTLLIVTIFDVVFFTASAPTRTLGRRKLVRNRFTIDTDIVFDGEPEPDLASPQKTDSHPLQQNAGQEQRQPSEVAGDTDRWVEEQFDLKEYEDPEEVKETDILSDDDEFSQTPRTPTEADLEAPVMALSLEGEETEDSEDLKSPMVSETPDDLELPAGVSDDSVKEQEEMDDIWVRRKHSDRSPDCEA